MFGERAGQGESGVSGLRPQVFHATVGSGWRSCKNRLGSDCEGPWMTGRQMRPSFGIVLVVLERL